MFSLLLMLMGISFVKANNVCLYGGYTGPGTMSSPNYPNDYTDKLNCSSYIYVSTGYNVVITFLAFNTETGNDWVTFECTSGNSTTSPRYSGSQIPPVFTISSCSTIKVSFYTDYSITKTGFRFAFGIKRFCETKHFSEPNGTISSANYPNAYENNLDCYSYIFVKSGHTIIITFVSFNTQTSYDWLKITCASGNTFTPQNYSGSQIPPVLTISFCNLVNVYFHTNGGTTYSGFSFNYRIISGFCDYNNFFGSSGQISSSNFSLPYNNYLSCSSYIDVQSGKSAIITFLTFNLESRCEWVQIACASGYPFTSPRYSGSQIPSVLTISLCNRVNVSFHTDGSISNTHFRLEYNIISGNILGGFITKPSNAFPRVDKNDPIIFNCTTATQYTPWWTMNAKGSNSFTITNSTCGVIASASYSYLFRSETLGSGSCNLIVVAPGNSLYLLAGTFVCTDSTLSSARAIIVPINLELGIPTGMNSLSIVLDIIRDGEIRLSCNSSFAGWNSDPSPVFTYFLYSGGPVAQMRIFRTYWTSEGSVVSSTDTSVASSYVLAKAGKDGVIPRYTCNIAFDFHSNISDITANPTIEMSFCTDPINVEGLYKTYQNLKLQILILGALTGVAVLTVTIILVILLSRKCRQLKVKTAAAVGHECDGNDYELQQRKGEGNVYSSEIGKAVDVDESEYGNLDTSKRRFEAAQEVYQALQLKK